MAPQRFFPLSGLNRTPGGRRLATLTRLTGFSSLGLLATGVTALASVAAVGVVQPACAADPYPEAVAFSRKAAQAVLNQEGRETCLRGKLTKALLKLSDSCDASAQRNPLCALANKAVVETPMSLTFMEDTSRRLLELSAGGAPASPGER
ncbi:MAG: hypothetical protein VKP70_03335 [Cyanobacteriota bacterium]|nr:hypothetical protein [Cyanobacteriota bacterium]